MPWFIKTEKFTPKTLSLFPKDRKAVVDKHIEWIMRLQASGTKIASGYLVNSFREPGGGGFLILKSNSLSEAKSLIEQDPIIIADLVTWDIQEWIPVADPDLSKLLNEDEIP